MTAVAGWAGAVGPSGGQGCGVACPGGFFQGEVGVECGGGADAGGYGLDDPGGHVEHVAGGPHARHAREPVRVGLDLAPDVGGVK
jgi:hypothetical protein